MTSHATPAVELGGRALHAHLLAEARAVVAAMNWDVPEAERRQLDLCEVDGLTVSAAG